MKSTTLSYIFAFVLAFAFVACQNDSTQTGDSTEAAAANQATPDNATTAAPIDPSNPNNYPKTGQEPRSPFQIEEMTEQMQRITNTLVKDYWVCTAYVKIKEPAANRANQGNWYQFMADGTFTFGHFTETLTKGSWTFAYKDNFGQVRLAADDPAYSGLWNVQINETEDIMIWVGSQEFQTNSIQQKLENLLFIPKNRKELGLKE